MSSDKCLAGNTVNAIALVSCINAYVIMAFGSETFSPFIFYDDGAISIATIGLVLIAQMLVLYEMATASLRAQRFDWLVLAYVLQIYVLREADFHRTFTDSNVTKGSYYLDPANPAVAKIVAGTLLIGCLVGLLYLGVKYGKRCAIALQEKAPWAIALTLWFGLLFLSQAFDKSPLNDSGDLRVKNIEEMLEFSAAIYIFLSALLYRVRPRQA